MATQPNSEKPIKMLFIIGAPRSGTTMLERMLSAHSMIQGGAEPHLLTPLAYTGYWDKVDNAPYDHILSSLAQRTFVEELPNGEQDYWKACRAFCGVLYSSLVSTSGKSICLDKTPAYALILPFIKKVFPDAGYIVLTRHPLAIFSSFANSFFDGDYQLAQDHEPLLNKYIPNMAAFLRDDTVSKFHVRYEGLVSNPESWMRDICKYLNIPFEPEMIEYGQANSKKRKGLGDPVGIHQHARPSTTSIAKWIGDLTSDASKLELMQSIIAQLDPQDLERLGYPVTELWQPYNQHAGQKISVKQPPLTTYRLQRKLIVRLRSLVRRYNPLKRLTKTIKLTCDVLLRE